MNLIYIANIRLPTEKAHGLQIVQNCEAFAASGASVTLWTASRFNTQALRGVRDIWAHYGVRRSFTWRRLPCLDLIPLVPGHTDALGRAAFYLQLWTFALAAFLKALRAPADVFYSRDAGVLAVLSLVHPRARLAYEAHRLAAGAAGRWIQRRVLRHVGTVIAITQALGEDLVALGADPSRLLIAPDGVRAERFAGQPERKAARAVLGWPADAFVVGYVGRLQTLALDKGVGTLVDALALVEGASLALVGGPDATVETLRERWQCHGLPPERFLYAGQVAPDAVPLYLSAFDVCAMPHPRLPHFERHTSPLKLFEYMASRRPLIASDLPGFREIVRDGVDALLVPPGDIAALAGAVTRLRETPGLGTFLAEAAYRRVMSRYTWDARARAILTRLASEDTQA